MQHLEGNLGAATSPLEARHRASRLNNRFHGGSGDFADYINAMRDMIARVRSGEDAVQLQKTIAGNTPFELTPSPGFARGQHKLYRRGVLLIHGLTDSPYSMRHLAELFRRNGFRVLALLLPGHGTRPGDLLDVTWQEWAKSVAYATEQLALEADEIYLAGYSAGAALAIHHSLDDSRVRGLFMFSPALDITHRAAWARVHKIYSWLAPKACWVSIKPDRDPYKYESFPKNAAAQLFALCQVVRHQLHDRTLNLPIFTAASLDDSTVIASATLQFMAAAPHALNHLVLYTTDPATPVPGMAAEQVELIDSRVPAQRILSSAHTALVQPPEDEHYGAHGEYCNCLHYYPDNMAQYHACWEHTGEVWLGEVTEQNLAAGTLRRLTYNPHYAELIAALQRFIERLP
ncbi:MAG TPA: alpha/beta fold hydrolase [Gallionellaceae bacterium]